VPGVEDEPHLAAADRDGLRREAIVERIVVAGCGNQVGGSGRRPGRPTHFRPRSAPMSAFEPALPVVAGFSPPPLPVSAGAFEQPVPIRATGAMAAGSRGDHAMCRAADAPGAEEDEDARDRAAARAGPL
jgi:hypothetical protein